MPSVPGSLPHTALPHPGPNPPCQTMAGRDHLPSPGGAPSRHNTTRPSSVLAGGEHSTHPPTPVFHPPPGPARLARLSPPVVVANQTDGLPITSTGPSQSSDCTFSRLSFRPLPFLLCPLVSSRSQFTVKTPSKPPRRLQVTRTITQSLHHLLPHYPSAFGTSR